MNNKTPLFQVPCPSTEFDGTAFLCENEILFKYYENGTLYQSGIRFSNVRAVRIRTEKSCTLWHVEGTYDTLNEVEESTWLSEIYNDTDANWRDKWEMHHYIIYLDSAGCFEIVAANWQNILDH